MAQELLNFRSRRILRSEPLSPCTRAAERFNQKAAKAAPRRQGRRAAADGLKGEYQMKYSLSRMATAVLSAVLLWPMLAMAAGGKANNIVVVADTRRVTGFLKYLSNLYNTDIWMFAVWAVVLTAALGCVLGFLMDFIMERTGLDLKSRKIIEH